LIVVSHNLDELARLVRRVILIRDGRLVADGTVRQILGNVALLETNQLCPPMPVALLKRLQASAGLPVRTDRLLPQEAAAEIAHAVASQTQAVNR
jgi:energy-coupling factor transport system ATP-binding protein